MSPNTRSLLLSIATATGMWAQNMYTATRISPSGMDLVTGMGINGSGQVVGGEEAFPYPACLRLATGCPRAFVYTGGLAGGEPSQLGWIGSATAINNSGAIVGFLSADELNPPTQAYLYSGGAGTALGFLGGANSEATGINDSGQVVGYSGTASGNAEAFLYSGGVMTGLGFLPGDLQSWATGINKSGQVVGYSANAAGTRTAFLYSGGVMTGLVAIPGYGPSSDSAINDAGQVVGSLLAGWPQAFLYSDGVMTGLGTLPGYLGSAAAAINTHGQVVGYASGWASGTAFLYSGGQMYDLNPLVSNPEAVVGSAGSLVDLRAASAINDSGWIVANTGMSTYLLTPLQGRFVPVTPCRVADTRTSAGPFGGPALDGVSARSFAIPQGACGIRPTAQAYSLNVTVVPQGPLAYLTLWPGGMAQPLVSTLNSFEGNVVANAAVVAAGQNGAVSVYATNPTDVILDINGYFDAIAGDSFYAVQPCRVEDTRRPAGPLGGPAFTAGETRDIPVLSGPCGLAATASAYSMNATVVPDGYLGFLTTWAAGQPQPFASTLNSWTGTVVANAAIVPAGANGATSVYVSNPTDVILDANGYFAAAGGPGALTFYPVVPCRVADTREADDGPILEAGTTRSFAIPESGCGITSSAAAYALNLTVVPDGPLGFLTAWPAGSPQPFVSTLNSWDGTVVANAAIVPAGTDGAVSVYVTNQTHVILDINGYFAP